MLFRCLLLGLLLTFSVMQLAACGGGRSGIKLSPVHERIMEANKRGLKNLENYRYQASINNFEMALRLSRSIDDREGALLAMLNLVRAYRAKGLTEKAELMLSEALTLVVPDDRLYADLTFERAKVLLASGDSDEATKWLDVVLNVPGIPNFLVAGAHNLKALSLMHSNRVKEAREEVSLALQAARRTGLPSRAAEADSLRVEGDIEKSAGNWEAAEARCGEALEIDRDMGRVRSVGYDLLCLGEAAEGAGRVDEALGYYRRAEMVVESAGELPRLRNMVNSGMERLESEGEKPESPEF